MLRKIKRNLLCTIGKHEYQTTQLFDTQTRRVGCPHCKQSWGMNHALHIMLPWDHQMHDLYIRLGDKVEYKKWEKQYV